MRLMPMNTTTKSATAPGRIMMSRPNMATSAEMRAGPRAMLPNKPAAAKSVLLQFAVHLTSIRMFALFLEEQ